MHHHHILDDKYAKAYLHEYDLYCCYKNNRAGKKQ